jgi:hypothetical protein
LPSGAGANSAGERWTRRATIVSQCSARSRASPRARQWR